ncbi:hypothetical protein Bca52824_014677 [Brassica carinata]|uniref:Polygalacturonase n=1 Tax=Brassica carinata TaxID=52824 RepID=A0A8X7W0K0_BRACI|nr:hypothetical protein Bca52824_014677 [Brassica carinata]
MGAYFGASTIFIFCLLGLSANAEFITIGSSSGSDITQALLKAFTTACQSPSPSKVVIPKGEFKLGEIQMRGPCKAPVEITIQGTVKADGNAIQKDTWIVFGNINGFKLNGGGVFDGEGNAAWRVNNCHQTFNCKKLPISIRFDFVENAEIRDISSIDAKNFHINILGAKNMTIDHIKIIAPKDSPNTDGIHLGRSDGVKILNTFISTGDDCISVGDGMKNLLVEKVTCGPGHGISVGSLGRYGYEEDVSGIRVINCTLQETDNGLRIKTWPSAACSTTASDIHFENIIVNNVMNPILIDQEIHVLGSWLVRPPYPIFSIKKKQYVGLLFSDRFTLQKPSTIKLANISFKQVRGTTGNKDAVKLLCSRGYPCQNVEIGDIDIKYSGADGPATFQCSNVSPKLMGTQSPKACTGPVTSLPQ